MSATDHAVVDWAHSSLCPMHQCEHVRVWCEHECHCETIAAVRERVAADLEAACPKSHNISGPCVLCTESARIARGDEAAK